MVLLVVPPAAALLEQKSHRLVKVYRIDRTDGVQLRFSDSDTIVEFMGLEYDPAGGFDATAARVETGMREANEDLRGIISSDRITTEDLFGGRYNEAHMTESLVDWRYPMAGPVFTRQWWITSTNWDGEEWRAEVSGLSRWLRQRVGYVLGRTCQYTLGDLDCGVVLDSTFVKPGVVTAVDSGEPTRIIESTITNNPADGFFDFGKVEWQTGNNIGVVSEVKEHLQSSGSLEFFIPTPYAIQVGDTFDATAGCDRLRSTCLSKFSNLPRNGAFPFMPTSDEILKRPSE